LGGKPEGRRPLGRPRRGWVDNIKMEFLKVIIWNGLGWPRLTQAFENGNEQSGSAKYGEFLEYLQTSWLVKKDITPRRK